MYLALSFQHFFVHASGIRICGVSCSIPFSPNSPTSKMLIAMSHWIGSRSLVQHHYWTFTETSVTYPTVGQYHGDPMVIGVQAQFLPISQ